MGHDGKKLRPVHRVRPSAYPSLRTFRDERRKVLGWLGAGGTAAAAGGLLGCDVVHDLLARPPVGPAGEPPPAQYPAGHATHPPATGDDDDSARPEVRQTRGEMRAVEPPTPEQGTGASVGPTHHPEARNRDGIRAARPDAQLEGDLAMPDPPAAEEATPTRPEARPAGRVISANLDEQ